MVRIERGRLLCTARTPPSPERDSEVEDLTRSRSAGRPRFIAGLGPAMRLGS